MAEAPNIGDISRFSDTAVTVSGTAAPGASVTLSDDLSSFAPVLVTADGSGEWSVSNLALTAGLHTLTATAGAETGTFVVTLVAGGDGGHTFDGSSGANEIYRGGTGTDAVDYSTETVGITIDLSAGVAQSAAIGHDTLLSIETVFSGSGDDELYGGNGDDSFSGGGGNDFIDGGAGTDTAQFSGNLEDYTVKWFSGAHDATGVYTIVGLGETETVTNVETLGFIDGSFAITAIALYNHDPILLDQQLAGDESLPGGESVGTIVVSDPDFDSVALTVSGGTGLGLFDVDPDTHVVSVHDGVVLDRESVASYTLQILAEDGNGGVATAEVTINLKDVNEFAVTVPVDSYVATNTINENATGTVGITAHASDSDATTNTVSYSLTSNPGGLFQIGAGTGVVTTVAAINREAVGPSVSIEVTATSADGSHHAQTFSIAINDLNDNTPSITSSTTFSAAENATAVGSVTATDNDATAANNTVSYSIVANILDDSALFSINSTTGALSFRAGRDYETQAHAYHVTVRASDGSLSSTKAITVNLTDVNDNTPTFTSAATFSVGENATAVGTVAASDADSSAAFHTVGYSIVNNGAADDGALFSINANTGVLSFKAGRDYETQAHAYHVTVRASDGSRSSTQAITVNLNDVNEPVTTPTDVDATADNIRSDAPIGTYAGITAHATDADATNSGVTYSLIGNPGSFFAIDPATGAIRTSAAIDFGTTGPAVTLTVRATSDDLSHADQQFVVSITDAAAVPGVTINGTGLADTVDATHTPLGQLLPTNQADVINGNGGNDRLSGLDGHDKLNGGTGNDLLKGGAGKDVIDGGAGSDTADYSDKTTAVTVILNGSNSVGVNVAGVVEDTIKNVENVTGGSAADQLIGDWFANVLKGGGGNDTLNGKVGHDTLTGGGGNDFFVFNSAVLAANADKITDFAHAVDSIRLENAVFKPLTATGTLANAAFFTGAAAHDASDRIIYNAGTGALLYDADGTGAKAAVQFGTLTAHLHLANADFFVI